MNISCQKTQNQDYFFWSLIRAMTLNGPSAFRIFTPSFSITSTYLAERTNEVKERNPAKVSSGSALGA